MFHPVEFMMQAKDGLKNLVSKIGHPSKDKSANWVWDLTPLSGPECLAMYASDWLPRKIVDIVPQDATREWRTWQAKDKQAEKLYALEKALKVRPKIMRAMQLDRLFGGSAILIGTGDKNPEEPLDVTKLGQNGIKYLRVFSRYDLRAGDLISNIEDDAYGLPQWYELLRQRDGKDIGLRIHRSRFVFFISNPLPIDWITYNASPEVSGNSVYSGFDSQLGWGQSIYEPIRKALMNAGAVAENVAALVEEAKLDVIQVPNLISYMNNDESQSKLISRFSLASLLKANNNMLLLGGDEKFDRKQISFAQLPEIMNANLQIASGAADIPIVRLLGQSPSGLNASGDTDMRMHYDKIKSHQTNDLKEGCLVDLDEAFIRSALGGRPEEIDYEFDSLWQMSQTELADISLKKSQAFMQINGLGLFAPEELRPAVADVIVDDGFLPTLDQHLLSEDEANNVIEEQQKQQLEQQQKLAGPDGPGGGPSGGPSQNKTPQSDSDWLEFLDANPDIAYDDNLKDAANFEETAHPRGRGGRWSDKPGMGNKTKHLPWWQQERVNNQLSKEKELRPEPAKGTSKEATPGTGGQSGESEPINEDELKHVVAFHGTSSKVLDSIVTEGIVVKPSVTNMMGSGIVSGDVGSDLGSVYVATDRRTAGTWSSIVARHIRQKEPDAKPIVFEIHIPEEEFKKFQKDPAAPGGFHGEKIKPEWIKSYDVLDSTKRKPEILETKKIRDSIEKSKDNIVWMGIVLSEGASSSKDGLKEEASSSKDSAAFQEVEHPRGPGGKFSNKPKTSSGEVPWWMKAHIGAEETKEPKKNNEGLNKFVLMESKITAQSLGYDPAKVRLNTGGHKFELNGVIHSAAAYTFLSGPLKGMIEVDPNNIGDLTIKGIVAHEVMHNKWQDVKDEYDKQTNEFWALPNADELIDENDNPKPEAAKKYPVFAEIKKHLGFDGMPELIADDGVTSYSKAHWDGYERGERGRTSELSIHETLAEIARLSIDNKGNPERANDKLQKGRPWREFYDAVNTIYASMKK